MFFNAYFFLFSSYRLNIYFFKKYSDKRREREKKEIDFNIERKRMNQLELFLTDLNSIQVQSDKSNEKLREYLFAKNGWFTLCSIYSKKIQVKI